MNEKQLRDILISELEERLFNNVGYESPMLKIFDDKKINFEVNENSYCVEIKYLDENKNFEIIKKYENLTHLEVSEKFFNEFVVPNSILEIDYSPYLKMLLIIMGYFWEEDACIHHYEIVNDMLSSGLSKYAIELRFKFLDMYTEEKIR